MTVVYVKFGSYIGKLFANHGLNGLVCFLVDTCSSLVHEQNFWFSLS